MHVSDKTYKKNIAEQNKYFTKYESETLIRPKKNYWQNKHIRWTESILSPLIKI